MGVRGGVSGTVPGSDAKQREHSLRVVFNGLRRIVKCGNQWRMMPHDLSPWPIVYQQTQRWIRAGCFTLRHFVRGVDQFAV